MVAPAARKVSAVRGAVGPGDSGDARGRLQEQDTASFHSPLTYAPGSGTSPKRQPQAGHGEHSGGVSGTSSKGWANTGGGLGGVGSWQSNSPVPDVRLPSHLAMRQ